MSLATQTAWEKSVLAMRLLGHVAIVVFVTDCDVSQDSWVSKHLEIRCYWAKPQVYHPLIYVVNCALNTCDAYQLSLPKGHD